MAVLAVTGQAMHYGNMNFFRQPYPTSTLSDKMWVKELLGGNPRCIKDQLSVQDFIRKLTSMTNASGTQHVDLEEQVIVRATLHHIMRVPFLGALQLG